MVRAKFRCTEKTSSTTTDAYGEPKPVDQERVKLQAVMGPGNEEWSRWTPSGTLELNISNPAALEQFKVGQDYFIDFTPA